jgi:hypothetical protein
VPRAGAASAARLAFAALCACGGDAQQCRTDMLSAEAWQACVRACAGGDERACAHATGLSSRHCHEGLAEACTWACEHAGASCGTPPPGPPPDAPPVSRVTGRPPDWPCARRSQGGAEFRYEYEGAPEHCSLSPHLHVLGCPAAERRVDLPIERTRTFHYDAAGRLDRVDVSAATGLPTRIRIRRGADGRVERHEIDHAADGDADLIERHEWSPDRLVVSRDEDADGSIETRVEYVLQDGRPLRSTVDHLVDGTIELQTLFHWEGDRLVGTTTEGVESAQDAWAYECGD